MPGPSNTVMPTIDTNRDVNIIYVNTGLSGVYEDAFLNPNNTTAIQHEATRNLTFLILAAATKDSSLGMSNCGIHANGANHIIIPVLRAALPMYVVAQTTLPKADTVLVRCTKNKRLMGRGSVEVKWMGRKVFAAESDLDGKDVLLMDTVVATGDTILKLLDEMTSAIGLIGTNAIKEHKRVIVLTCYASPQALSRIKGHPLVKGIVVGVLADSVDRKGFLFPSTGGDMGDKLFGEEAKR